jgi:biotin transport system substrate-specific component
MSVKTKDIALVALFTAMVVVLGLIPPMPVPWVPVPITLQTFGVMLAGLILGPYRAGLVVALYVLIALVGLPVLPGGRAGLAVLAGPTGGFLLGMIPGAIVVGLAAGASTLRCLVAALLGGVAVVYALGIPWLMVVTGMTFSKAALAVVVFLPGDTIKAVIASIVAQRIRRLNLV